MIDDVISSGIASGTGVLHTPIRRSLDTGEKTLEAKKAETEKNFEDTKKVLQVPMIYNAKGEIMEYGKYGRPINIRKIMEYENSVRHLNIKG